MQQDYLPVEVYEAWGICWENYSFFWVVQKGNTEEAVFS